MLRALIPFVALGVAACASAAQPPPPTPPSTAPAPASPPQPKRPITLQEYCAANYVLLGMDYISPFQKQAMLEKMKNYGCFAAPVSRPQ